MQAKGAVGAHFYKELRRGAEDYGSTERRKWAFGDALSLRIFSGVSVRSYVPSKPVPSAT